MGSRSIVVFAAWPLWLAALGELGCVGSIHDQPGGQASVDAGQDGAIPVEPIDAAFPESDAGPAVDPSAELYARDRFPRFDLEIAPDQLAALEVDPRTYARATFRYGDEQLDEIGVRLKGEYTFRPIYEKASFKLKFDEFVPGQELRGLRRMTLNNAFEDPSFVAERLTYEAFRNAGLPAPRANSAMVYVNGELYGVYVNIETEDKTFLSRWFASNDGNLYEEAGADWYPGNEWVFDLETNETIDDRSDLTALFAAVESARDESLLADVGQLLDTDHFLRFCALEGLVNQWDGYAYTVFGPNNYRLYHDPTTGQFTLIPWGMDMSMKPYGGQLNLDLHAATGAFFQRCLAVEACAATYWAVVAEETDRFEALGLDAIAAEAHAQIREAVYSDPKKEHDDETFEWTYEQVVEFVLQRPGSVRARATPPSP